MLSYTASVILSVFLRNFEGSLSYCVYIGKNHSADGHAWLAGYGDEPSSHWLEIFPEQSHPEDALVEVGVTPSADLPGVRSSIPQVVKSFRKIRVSYSHYKGVPAPVTNGGLNEHGVAVRSVWSPSRKELIEMTSKVQSGPSYSDLAGFVLERATTAREGVEVIAKMIKKYGESTYGGNTHVIADATEAWIMIEPAGGKGLWAAERLSDDAIRACRPGYIGSIPIACENHPDFIYSQNLVSFAKEMGWYVDGNFDFNAIYGDGAGVWAGARWVENELETRAMKPSRIEFRDMVWALRTERLTGDTAGYGQIVPLVNPVSNQLRMLWHAPSGAVSAPFSPVFMGQTEIPLEFGKHRYLTVGEAARFLDTDKPVCGGPETLSKVSLRTESFTAAVVECKRLLYLILQNTDSFLEQANLAFTQRERSLVLRTKKILKTAEVLTDSGHRRQCEHLLDYFSTTELLEGLALVKALNALFEIQVRATEGLGHTSTPLAFDQIW
ncbi:C69 family dipeptidase [Sulfitobacter indolifex]|uniref:C69 family dipeptidase n=1 Tax=Sulfitobacter indolifex TaxID=225422 RepID=UPI00197DA135|nr:C69 family dipeptidase [Sulfitobacter indolifex]